MSKVTFDGDNKLIIINAGVTDLNVEKEIYIPWKEWVLDGHSMYLAAFRTFGGDPTTTDQNAPSYFFLINNWKVKAENVNVVVHENLYSDDYTNPYTIINSSVLSKNSDIPGITDISNTLTGMTQTLNNINSDVVDINNTLTGMTGTLININSDIVDINNTLTGMTIDLKLILGLTQHNYRLSDHIYDSGQRLISVKIKLYNTKDDCDDEVNSFATYQMNATYDAQGLLIDYKVVKL